MRKFKKNHFFILLALIVVNCSPKTLDVILYDNKAYDSTNFDEIIFVKSRLDIKEKYFEIGVIKATKETTKNFIKKIAAKNGANIIVDEGNLNFTLIRVKNQKREKPNDEKYIKT
jgi:predicted rRNA methylase YqxC with S4 and FtsJ domains